MSEKPNAKKLAGDAKKFCRDNRGWMIEYAKPLLPYLVAAEAAVTIGVHYSKGFALAGFLTAYIMACFALSWHRAVLLGPKAAHAIDPFAIKKDEKSFLVAFFMVMLIPVASGLVGGLFFGLATATKNGAVIAVAALIFCVLVVVGVMKSLRMSFMLPARSVGVQMTREEAKQISRGLIGAFFKAGFRVTIMPVLAFTVWVFLASIISVAAFEENSLSAAIGDFVLIALPGLALNILLAALNVTVLSYLYQWSVQNRLPGQT